MAVNDLRSCVFELSKINEVINKLNEDIKKNSIIILENNQQVAKEEIAKTNVDIEQSKGFCFNIFANNKRNVVANIQSENQVENEEDPQKLNKSNVWRERLNKAKFGNASTEKIQENGERNQSI